MNYTDVVLSAAELDAKKINHSLIEWKGKHEWPDSVVFEKAFYWCSFNAMRNKTIPVNKELVQNYLQQVNKQHNSGSAYLQFSNLPAGSSVSWKD